MADMNHRRLTREEREERRDRIAELTRQGLSARAIAEILNTTSRTVVRDRVRGGCAQARAPQITADEIARAQAMLGDGASYNEVARTLGRSHRAIKCNLPGYTWDQQSICEAAAMGLAMARLERSLR